MDLLSFISSIILLMENNDAIICTRNTKLKYCHSTGTFLINMRMKHEHEYDEVVDRLFIILK